MLDNQTAVALAAGTLGLVFWYGLLPIFIVFFVWREYRSNPLAGLSARKLALRKFRINESSSPTLDIVGRTSGILGWFLTLLKVDPESHFRLDEQEASFRTASVSGLTHHYVPLEKITSTSCSYFRSVMALGIAAYCALSFIGSLIGALGLGLLAKDSNTFGLVAGAAFVWLVLGAIATAWYFLSQKIAIVVRSGSSGFGFLFKRSMIENVSVDLPEALAAIAVLNARVAAAQAGFGRPLSDSAPITTKPCPKCSLPNGIDLRFCESCGFSLA